MHKLIIYFLLASLNLFSDEWYKTTVNILGEQFTIMETGKFTIDIRRDPIPIKSDAMRDYLDYESFSGVQGAYFGNQNQFPEDRDATMVQIPGLTVYGVDLRQEKVIEGIERIGIGPDATLKKLQEILALPLPQRPVFLAFDIDDTLLGLTKQKTKEELNKERKELGLAIAKLAKEGTQIAFFSDASAQATLVRIGYPLTQMLESLALENPVILTFYSSGMITKFKLIVDYLGEPIVVYQPSFNAHCRIGEEHTKHFLNAIGHVTENESGEMLGSGILKEYYFAHLAVLDENGNYVRNSHFHTEFLTTVSTLGNVIPPKVEVSDYNPIVKDVSKITIVGIPTDYRRTFINLLKEKL